MYRAGESAPIYVGVAKSLRRRWLRQHLRSRSGSSALRRSLAVELGLVETKLRRPARTYDREVEEHITAFLLACEIELHVTTTREEAEALERNLIHRLSPTLNVVRYREK